jgi:hypothetical protein
MGERTVDAWFASMPAAVGRQRGLLERLLAAVAAEPATTAFVLSCSLARGAGDAWSDVDAGVAVDDAYWPDAVAVVVRLVRDLGQVADVLVQHWPPGQPGDSTHVFAQYADGLQLSLVVRPASQWQGRAPGEMVLYDPGGAFTGDRTPAVLRASADDVREWAFLGWIALADLVKYVDRRSAWEALARLDDARAQAWRLWAVAAGLDYPTFGLTAVLDDPAAGTPPGIEATVARLDLDALLAAARRLAEVLDDAAARAAAVVPAELPHGMARHVRGLLHRAVPE